MVAGGIRVFFLYLMIMGVELSTVQRQKAYPQIAQPYIIFVSERKGSQAIYLYNLENRSLVDTPGLNFLDATVASPSISENGKYITFAATRNGRSAIYLYDRQTQQRRNLTENIEAEVRNPSISSDGGKIVYEIARNGHWEIGVTTSR